MRYRNVNSGALVDVRDDKVLGSEWELQDEKKAPAKRSASSSAKSEK